MVYQEVLSTDTPNAGRTKWNANDQELYNHVSKMAANSVEDRALRQLFPFLDWLDRFNAKGFIGEIAVPRAESTTEWNRVLDRLYSRLDDQDIWATAWSTSDHWGDYNLQPYMKDAGGNFIATPTATVLEAHPTTPRYERGVNASGAEFNARESTTFSNTSRGVHGTDYFYPSQTLLTFLAGRGVTLIRLPFRWERIQPTLGGALDAAELTLLKDTVSRAATAGLKVILDIHNYAEYKITDAGGVVTAHAIGSATVTQAHFTDLWTRLSAEFQANTTVVAYDIMNEPERVTPTAWQTISQAAVDAIRTQEAAGAKKHIIVPTAHYSGAHDTYTNHPSGPWITDAANNIRYTAHYYPDRNNSGTFVDTFASDRAWWDDRNFRARSPERDAFIHEHSADDGSGQFLRNTIFVGTPTTKANFFAIESEDGSKGYRLRSGGGALDLDFSTNAYISTFADMTWNQGSQRNHMVFEHNPQQLIVKSNLKTGGNTVDLGTTTERFNQGFFNSLGSRSGTAAPTTTDIPDGSFVVWKNTTSGELALWANDGGVLKKTVLA